MTRHLDLDDTSRCPRAERCAQCTSRASLRVCTAELRVRVICVTLCRRCAAGDPGSWMRPLPSWRAAIVAVMAHCGHLGIDLDQMAQAIQDEQRRDAADRGGHW